MKKGLLMIALTLSLIFAVGGCATKGDLKDVQAREMAISVKADQAAHDAQVAKAAADEALMRANEAAERAALAEKRAEERERAAEERIKKAEALFKKSMEK